MLFRILRIAIAACLAVMVVLVFGNVVLRYVFNSGITVSEELSRWLFVWMTFLGAVVALGRHGHLGSDMLVARLSPAGRRACLILGQCLMIYVTWLLLAGSWSQTVINREVEAPVTGLPVALFYGSGVVFAVLSGIVLIGQLWRTITDPSAALVMTTDSEDLPQPDRQAERRP